MQSVLPFEKSISNGAQNNFFILFPDILHKQVRKSSSGLGFKHYIQPDFQTLPGLTNSCLKLEVAELWVSIILYTKKRIIQLYK
jgi:hypothetical protein